MAIRIGTSGFSYRWWRGRFYPREVKPPEWLGFYARRFDTVELNATFYRLPEPERFRRWAAQVPEGFLFAVKVSRVVTHLKRLRGVAEPLAHFFSAVSHLGAKLGPVLHQLPPSLKRDDALLADFLRLLPPERSHAFEFRHESWFDDAVYALLDAHGCAFCVHDHHGMRVPRVTTGQFAYWRFHGTGTRGECYGAERLRPAAAALAAIAAGGRDVFAYFNNDAMACAVRDAQELQGLIHELRASA